MQEQSPQFCVERYLFHQASQQWEEALEFLSDEFLEKKYGFLKAHCTKEAALRYGFDNAEEARTACNREFVARMLRSATRDAEGRNPSHHCVPGNSDCHILCKGDEVIVTLSTGLATSRTRYITKLDKKTTRRMIVDSDSESVVV